MAGLWSALNQEFRATVNDFQQKSPIEAFRDAAFETRDAATTTGLWFWEGAKSVIGNDRAPVLRVSGTPVRGNTLPLEFPDGRIEQVTVVGFDDMSEPPLARVAIARTGKLLTVSVGINLEPSPRKEAVASAFEGCSEGAQDVDRYNDMHGGMLAEIKQGWQDTVQEFHDKDAAGIARDAALDGADVVAALGSFVSIENPPDHSRPGEPEVTMQGSDVPSPSAIAAVVVDPKAPSNVVGSVTETDNDLVDGSISYLDMPLLEGLKEDWRDTVQEFRDKGTVAAVRDATLDAADIVGSTAAMTMSGVRSLAAPLVCYGAASRNTSAQQQDSPSAGAADLEPAGFDTAHGLSHATLDVSGDDGDAVHGSISLLDMPLLDGLKQDWRDTIDDFHEKGTIGAVRDAALDAADIVGSTAATAFSCARSFAEPIGDGPHDLARWHHSDDREWDSDGLHDRSLPMLDGPLLGGLKREWQLTAQSFQVHGGIGAAKEATLDAADLVRNAAATAFSNVCSVARPFGSVGNIDEHGPCAEAACASSSPSGQQDAMSTGPNVKEATEEVAAPFATPCSVSSTVDGDGHADEGDGAEEEKKSPKPTPVSERRRMFERPRREAEEAAKSLATQSTEAEELID